MPTDLLRRPCASLLLLMLAACTPATDPQETVVPEPQTWAEYVASEIPRRAARHEISPDLDVYFRDGLPDIRGWTLEDMLPPEALNQTHIDMCELDDTTLNALWEDPTFPDNEQGKLDRILKLAGEGYLQAQVIVGNYCYESEQPDALISHHEVLSWLQKAATSERGYAMGELASCMTYLRGATGVPRASFETDKELYWHQRAAQQLHPLSLRELAYQLGSQNFTYRPRSERFKHEFLLRQLFELSTVFTGDNKWVRGLLGTQRLVERYNMYTDTRPDWEITDAVVQEAEAKVTQWLLDHPDAFAQFDLRWGCRQSIEAWGDYEAVNVELARFGLHVVPPGHIREGIAPELDLSQPPPPAD
ncbi:MAG: hypothetical protein LAT63_01645 [Marinobacter sp.]|nr:hypothetical protein [Marinobacter sp.]